MTPTLNCVRHAQGYHNLSVANHSMRDPQLTPHGEEQCRTLAASFPEMDAIDLIVASPMKRTLRTALLSFAPVIAKKELTVLALPELQETSDLPCDTGSAKESQIAEFKDQPVDFSRVGTDWNNKRDRWAPTAAAIKLRAQEARVWLMNRPEKNIAVVTHGSFLHYFTEDWSGSERYDGTGWANTEHRSFAYSSYEPSRGHLIETPDSLRHRHAVPDKPLDHNEQTQLQRTLTSPANGTATGGSAAGEVPAGPKAEEVLEKEKTAKI